MLKPLLSKGKGLINSTLPSTKEFAYNWNVLTRADPGFSFGGGGGGGANDYVRTRTSRARSPKSLTARIQGPLKGPGSSRGFLCPLALSEPYF